MYRFKQKARPLDLPALDLRLVDTLTFEESKRQRVIRQFNAEFGEFLEMNLPEVTMCLNGEHLDSLFTEYIRESKALRNSGKPVPILEEWSRTNGRKWTEDFRSAPHEGVMWFELQSIASGLPVGVLEISQVNVSRSTRDQLTLSGYALMTLPQHPRLSYAQYWGEVLKALLDQPFVSVDDPAKSVVFDEWIFPTESKVRWVSRPGFTSMGDAIDTMSSGILIEREDSSREFAPKNIRKTARPE